jgi:hypothetical protein
MTQPAISTARQVALLELRACINSCEGMGELEIARKGWRHQKELMARFAEDELRGMTALEQCEWWLGVLNEIRA